MRDFELVTRGDLSGGSEGAMINIGWWLWEVTDIITSQMTLTAGRKFTYIPLTSYNRVPWKLAIVDLANQRLRRLNL